MRKFRPYLSKHKSPIPVQERRIVIPAVAKRPVRFQARSIIRKEFVRVDPAWAVTRRRGINRGEIVGINPLEARAVPHSEVRGTLPERILFKYLVSRMRFVPGIDFSFQSSLQGGRVDKGGILADFDFPILKIILNPLGPTHDQYLRMRKDEEQIMTLEEMGYKVYMIPEKDVYDEIVFENTMRNIFGLRHSSGSSMGYDFDMIQSVNGYSLVEARQALERLRTEVLYAIRNG